MKFRGSLACLSAAVAALTTLGADLRTLDGRVFREAEPRKLDEDRLTVKHSGGEAVLYFYEIPEVDRRALGYDTDAALKRLLQQVQELRRSKGSGAEAVSNPGPKMLNPKPAVPAPFAVAPTPTPAPSAPRLLPAAASIDTGRASLWNGLQPPKPASELPVVGPEDTVTSWELVNHFRSEPPAAAARYGRRTFRVTGVIERIDKSLATRLVRIFLETPDPAVRPVIEWRVDDRYNAFHTQRDGRTLVGQDGRTRSKLLEAGETVVFEVKGGPFEDGVVELKQARRRP
jgi:hypothetical protein